MPKKRIYKLQKPEHYHEYWKLRSFGKNSPEKYMTHKKRSKFLINIFKENNLNKDSKILEIGCNVGRNLNALYMNGYGDLSGIELNYYAIDVMSEKFSDVFNNVNIYNSLLEECLPKIKDDTFDICFSMAVLMHIHPDSIEKICKRMSRIAKTTITIEEEIDLVGKRHWGRNYQQIFESLGMNQIFVAHRHKIKSSFGRGYFCRIFERK